VTADAQKAVSSRVQTIMEVIDREGEPPLSKEEWIALLERVCSECESRAEGARDELRSGE
jgi:hypothetical protein